MAVTNKCPLACEHCYEWDALNRGERLTLSDLKTIVQKIQDRGVSQIHLSGGEPLVRINDVVEVVQTANEDAEFWILTSGFKLTYEKACTLKQAGLTGVLISLDHYEPENHNKFRGHKDAFHWVEEAVRNSIAAKLVTALSICATKDFVAESNLIKYMELAKSMGVSFVQILEPRATGHYKNKDVRLTPEQEKTLEAFYLSFNYEEDVQGFSAHQLSWLSSTTHGLSRCRKQKFVIDTYGDIHACPFCQRKAGNVLSDDLEGAAEKLQWMGCHQF